MGTNHYVKMECPNACDHCNIEDIHIGKSGKSLEGHRNSPWGPIESWQDWKRVITENNLNLINEYGDEMTHQQLFDYYESTDLVSRSRQYRWVLDEAYQYIDDGTYIMDADGFTVCFTEFS